MWKNLGQRDKPRRLSSEDTLRLEVTAKRKLRFLYVTEDLTKMRKFMYEIQLHTARFIDLHMSVERAWKPDT
jgi:hypothetical protein